MKHAYLSRIGILAATVLALPLGVAAQSITGFSPTFARIGETFTISGTGLATTSAVTINGETMPFTYNAVSGALTVTVPRLASSGIVRVTTSSGTAITSKGFRVTRLSTSFSFPAAAAAVTGAGTAGDYSTPCLADLDDDGLLDMIVGFGSTAGSGNRGTLQRYEQASSTDGNFTSTAALSPRALTVGAAATAGTPAAPGNPAITVTNFAKPYITDLDGDGLLDLLIGENDGRVFRYEQNSLANPNNFDAAVLLFANPEGTAATSRLYCRPTVVDLNGNGLLDVLVGGNDGRIRRYEQNAANTTTTAGFADLGYLQDVTAATPITLDGGDVSKAQVLDVDGDGLLDLLVGNAAGNLIQYTQSAVGAVTFVRPTTNSFSAIVLGATQYAAPVIADIDGDGLLDMMLGNNAVATNVSGSTNTAGTNVLRYEQTNNSTPTPLPVVLKAFSGQATSDGSVLRWSTAQELNSDKFVLERSADGKNFREVAQVRAAGNSTATQNYQYADASAEARTMSVGYYRLQQQDLDGSVNVSPVVVVSRSGSALAAGTVSPNPFSQELFVSLPTGTEPQPTQVALTTLAGATVYSAKLPLSANPQLLPALPELKSGLYLLRLTTATSSSVQRVVRR
ncbi:FG-GAP-like repeat-containing protein [Hymenobacter canadensis]|uniref:FG-GAP-like repeat-containing protein n=1 Tax=Hymenobacter canadensis TaxID=2999067 RepID=A0ABY7LKJ1_9BACT|nr:FG-GAP-like repeat-containing protein [Hymenobacter canadensis]WBA40119.1 FG-GAP-like repeat-containing protein [Hymenobacter canadensis]